MRQLAKFFLFTFLTAWTCFICVAIISHNQEKVAGLAPFLQILIFLGTISPSLAAFWITARNGKAGETQTLLNRIVKWRVNIGWYLFAAGYFAFLKLIVALIYYIFVGTWPQFGQELWYIMVVAIPFSTMVQAGEEIGWRGFALPRMTEKYGLALSTLLLGVIWAVWHLPLFFVRGADTFGQSFPLYFMQVTAISVAMGWLYWRTQGSLLLVMLLHAAINNTKDIVPSAVPGAVNPFALSNSLVAWLTLTLLWICAAYLLFRMRNVSLLKF